MKAIRSLQADADTAQSVEQTRLMPWIYTPMLPLIFLKNAVDLAMDHNNGYDVILAGDGRAGC